MNIEPLLRLYLTTREQLDKVSPGPENEFVRAAIQDAMRSLGNDIASYILNSSQEPTIVHGGELLSVRYSRYEGLELIHERFVEVAS